jgi:hypothetical protein
MSLRRWLVLLAFVLTSLVLSLGWVIWMLVGGAGNRIGIAGILQFLELFIAFGLLSLAEWAQTWGLRWYAVKAVYAGGMGIGLWASGMAPDTALIALPICLFYTAFALFLFYNDEFFD